MPRKISMIAFLLVYLFCAGYAEDKAAQPGKIEQKLADMKITKFSVKKNFSKLIPTLYLFDENGMRGGVALTKLDEYGVDFFVVVIKNKDYSLIKYVEVMDENALRDKNQMKELIAGLARLNETKIDNVTDAISGATPYTKKVYLKVKVVAAQVAKELETAK